MNKKEKILESDLEEPNNIISKRKESIAEATTSTVDKDTSLSKIKAQTVKNRLTQSGPLIPGTVFSHSLSDIGRRLEKYVVFFYCLFVFLF